MGGSKGQRENKKGHELTRAGVGWWVHVGSSCCLLLLTSAAAAAAKSRQSCPTLCNPIDGSPPGSPIPGILQARTLAWIAISFSNAWKWKVKVKSLSRVWLSEPMDRTLPGSSVHGIFQVRVLEWVSCLLLAYIQICPNNNKLWCFPTAQNIVQTP